ATAREADHLLFCGLPVAALADRAAHDPALTAGPVPQVTEPRVRLRQHRLLQLRGRPGDAAVGAHIDAANLSGSRPRDAVDLYPAAAERDRVRGICDERPRVHQEAEDPRGAVGHWIGVLGGFFASHERA